MCLWQIGMLPHQSVLGMRGTGRIRVRHLVPDKPRALAATQSFHAASQPVLGYSHVGIISRQRPTVVFNSDSAITNKYDPQEWTNALERALPRRLRASKTLTLAREISLTEQNDLFSEVIMQARRQVDLNVMMHLGFVQGRWDALLWIIDTLLQEHNFHNPAVKGDLPVINFPVAKGDTLDGVTSKKTRFTPNRDGLRWALRSDKQSQNTLNRLTAAAPSTLSILASKSGSQILGQIWRTLGSMILSATDRSHSECNLIMKRALQIFAKLHRIGLVPKITSRVLLPEDHSNMQMPELLNLLSTHMLSSLIDEPDETSGADLKAVTENDGSYPLSAAARFPPELWFELVLWCSVQSGWVLEACEILHELKLLRGRKAWSLTSWQIDDALKIHNESSQGFYDMSVAPDQDSVDYEETEMTQLPFGQLITSKRSISREVVVALLESLMAMVILATPNTSYFSMPEVYSHIQDLKGLLDCEHKGLGTTTWTEVTARLFDCSTVFQRKPKLVETVLDLLEKETSGQDRKNGIPVSAYAVPGEDRGAVIGLLCQILKECVVMRDLDKALRVIVRLQATSNMEKGARMAILFRRLQMLDTTITARDTPSARASLLGSKTIKHDANATRLLPEIPVHTLASLLDIATDTGRFEIGRWMVYPTEGEGALISSELYGNAQLAPVLIRFAALCEANELLTRVVQSNSVSSELLVALCAARTSQRCWQDAENILQFLTHQNHHAWTAFDLAYLVRSLVPHLINKREEGNFVFASKFVRRLLQTIPTTRDSACSVSQTRSIAVVTSSIHPLIREAIANVFEDDELTTLNMDLSVFTILLQSAVTSCGSEAGKLLYCSWCRGHELTHHLTRKTKDPGEIVDNTRPQQQSAMPLKEGNVTEQSSPAFVLPNTMEPSLSYMFVIIQQALQEFYNDRHIGSSRPRHAVLEWAKDVLQQDFAMGIEEARYYLGSYCAIRDQETKFDASFASD